VTIHGHELIASVLLRQLDRWRENLHRKALEYFQKGLSPHDGPSVNHHRLPAAGVTTDTVTLSI
jgi:hypothetical protein